MIYTHVVKELRNPLGFIWCHRRMSRSSAWRLIGSQHQLLAETPDRRRTGVSKAPIGGIVAVFGVRRKGYSPRGTPTGTRRVLAQCLLGVRGRPAQEEPPAAVGLNRGVDWTEPCAGDGSNEGARTINPMPLFQPLERRHLRRNGNCPAKRFHEPIQPGCCHRPDVAISRPRTVPAS